MAEFDMEHLAEAMLDIIERPLAAQAKRIDALEKALAEALARPVATDGAPGRDGKDADMDAIRADIAEMVADAVKAIPAPRDGVDGRDGAPGERGEKGDPGKDGVGLAGALIDRDGKLVLTLSNGETKELGLVVGRDGVNGNDGAAGADGRDGQDGQDGKSIDADVLAEMVCGEVKKAVEHVKAMGADADPDLLPRLVSEEVAKAVAAIPPAKDGADGAPGADGKDADLEQVARMVDHAVAEAVKALPAPRDGKDGAPGVDGRDGLDGKSITPDDVAPLLSDMVAKAVAEIPVPQDGKDGRDGVDGQPGKDGADGKSVDPAEIERIVAERFEKAVSALPKPKDGRDGLDVVDLMRNEKGHLIGVLSNGQTKDLGRIDGADGFGFDDLEFEYDGERGLKLSFVQGDRVKEFTATLPIIIDRGVWKAGTYQRGDAVSFGGALWVAQVDKAMSKPGENGDWRLAVKKGRDGRDANGNRVKPGGGGGA